MLDLLDLAQIENQSVKINEEFLNLHEVIENSFRVIKHYADKKFVKLICSQLPANEHEVFSQISGDARRYMQIIINFLSNALKFFEDNSKILINVRLNEILAIEPMQDK